MSEEVRQTNIQVRLLLLKHLALSPLIMALACGILRAQDGPPIAETPADNGNIPASLIQPIERAADYLNFFAFFNGTYNEASSSGQSGSQFGSQFGGGVSSNHDFARGTFSLGYRVDYLSRTNSGLQSGVEQTVSFFYRRVLTPRWTLSLAEEGGTYPQGTVVQQPTSVIDQQFAQTSPYSSTYRFSASTVSLAYRQTARLTYALTGTFLISRYTSALGLGNDDVVGTATALYQLSHSTSVSGTFQDTYFHFQRNAGTSSAESEYLTVSHVFPSRWTLGLSAGATHVNDQGSYPVPIYLKSGDTILPFIYVGHYKTSANLPYFSASISRSWQHSIASITAGQSVTPGNGVFLTSRTRGISGVLSYSTRRSNISAVGSWSYLTSASNTSTSAFTSTNFGGSYSYNVIRHLGVNTRFDHVLYGFGSTKFHSDDNRLTFGLYFTSKDIPLAIF